MTNSLTQRFASSACSRHIDDTNDVKRHPERVLACRHTLRLFRKPFDVRERTEVTERRIGSTPSLSAPRIRVLGRGVERQMKGRVVDLTALELEAIIDELGHGREIVGRLG